MGANLQRLTFLLLAWLVSLPALAAPVPSPPEVDGQAAYLMEVHSGRTLASQNPDKPWPPASLTKMMTLYTAFKAIEDGTVAMGDQVRVSEKAYNMPGSRMFLELGSQVPMERIIRGIIVQSGNDACVALAEHVAGTEKAFVQLMNAHAEELGLGHTHFEDASGLPAEGMQITARDAAHLAAALIREFPDYYDLFDIRKMTHNGIQQYNRNRLLWWDDSVDGVKTGHTKRAGYHLVASAERDGMRLVSVVLGTDSEKTRAQESQSLLNYGFRFYRTYRLYQGGEELHTVKVWKGDRREVGVALTRDLYVTLPRGARKDLEVTLDFQGPLMAPVAKGREIGRLTAKLRDRTLAERPLITAGEVAQGGILRRISDTVRLWFTE